MKEYALYKGDNLIEIGTLKEIADKQKVSKRTIAFYSTPTYKNRGKGEKGNRKTVIRIDE